MVTLIIFLAGTVDISYAKQHPEIFALIEDFKVKPIFELKENETVFEYLLGSGLLGEKKYVCTKCDEIVQKGNFCSNCGRKRLA